MKKIQILIVLLFFSHHLFSWGLTGHRVVGEVAENHLIASTKFRLSKILNNVSLAEVSNWMDEVKSDNAYDSLRTWHYVSIPDGSTYANSDINPKGDLISAIEYITEILKKGGLSAQKEVDYIKILVHLVGDLHQPLHVGRKSDRGGNDIKVEWFRKRSNLHKVWDSQMIDDKKYSYTELATIIDKPNPEQVKVWQKGSVRDWAHEAMQYRDQIYDLPEDKKLSYEYQYKNWDLCKNQLLKGGIRLAAILNDIYA